MNFLGVYFKDPEYFNLFWLVPLLALFLWWASRRRKRLLERFGRPDLLGRLSTTPLAGVGFARRVLVLAALVFLIFAVARPQYGKKPVILKREGRDIVFLLDTSLSMLAEDIKPNRLARARFEIVSLLGRLEGDRVALVPFAGDAVVLCPLTTDYDALGLFLEGADTDIISLPGTDISRALKAGAGVFDQEQAKYKVMVLITDGEQLEGDALEVVSSLKEKGIRLYAIGIGSTEGVPIPLKEAGGGAGHKRDDNSQVVISRLGEALLVELARSGGGEYYRAGREAIELDRIFEDIKKLEKRELEARDFTLYHDRYQWPLGIALVLLLAESLLWDGRRAGGARERVDSRET
ncbi:MAG: VWA domain-containing protein [Candidatus Glassbacteria bacterium]|nr:VWA domain-containing protein [Candidatus Glassbacteria bacterium]